ncbi:MAG: hypothetical protein MAG451_03201 [Anaerolineales bacterium]|nr:hypothetical protein [Anaerolineales bacterium]
MRHTRIFLVVILSLTLLLAACSAQAAGIPAQETTLNIIDTAADIIPEIDLPALTLTYDQQGVPSIFGFSTTQIQRLTGMDLSILNLDPVFIDWFMRSNLQHVEIEHTENGLLLFANGQLLPSVGWNTDTLSSAVDVAEMMDIQNASVIKRLVPVLQKLGLHFVIRFPVASGNDSISLHERGAVELPALADVEGEAPVIQLAVEYREDGLPSILGLTSRDITALTGIDLSPIELSESTIQRTRSMNLQSVELETHADGLYVFLNGKEVPRLAYGPEQLDTVVSLYGQMYPASQPAPAFLRTALMTLQQLDLDFIVQFPLAAGAERLPLHEEM